MHIKTDWKIMNLIPLERKTQRFQRLRKDNDKNNKFGRNLEKPFKQPKVIVDEETGETRWDPLQMLRMGPSNLPRQSNGCKGDVSSFMGAGATSKHPTQITGWDHELGRPTLSKIEHQVNPDNMVGHIKPTKLSRSGKVRNPKTRKKTHINSALRYGGTINLDSTTSYETQKFRSLYKLRADLYTAIWIKQRFLLDSFESDVLAVLQEINKYLRDRWPVIFLGLKKRDENAMAALVGRIRCGQIRQYVEPNDLRKRLESASYLLNQSNVIRIAV